MSIMQADLLRFRKNSDVVFNQEEQKDQVRFFSWTIHGCHM